MNRAPDAPETIGDYAFVNGQVLTLPNATISVLDRGLLRGEGVFETIRSYDHVPFAVRRHLARMATSARAAGIRLPPADELQRAVEATNSANGFANTRFQLTVTGGPGGPGPDPLGEPEPTTIVIAAPISEGARGPVTAVSLPWVRHEGAALTGVKPTSYLDHLVGHKWAHGHDADEGLWRNSAGEFTEATGSNLFVVKDGTVITPPTEAGLLPGVTRDLILMRCVARGIPAEERPLPALAVMSADECFLTSTTKEAVAVVSVDGNQIGVGDFPVLDGILADWRKWAPAHPDP